ncbi:MAG: nitroreductase family protein [Bacteroidota bacterium]
MKVAMYNMELDIEPQVGMRMEQQEFDPFKTPYEVDEQMFPWYDTLREQFAFLVRYAILAPSSHNTQPWKFKLSDDGIAVYADYTRRLPVADPGNRELIMSVGAAITNLRVAAAHFGFEGAVEYNQSGDSERPLAFVRLSRPQLLSASDRKLAQFFPAITKRHTNRNPFLMARIPDQVITQLNEFAQSSVASIYISRDGDLNQQVAGLVAAADKIQQSDPEFRKELAEWIRPNYTRKPDGMTGANFGINDLASVVAPWATKAFDLGKMRAAKDKNLCLEAPGLVVLYSEDAFFHWVEVGELLQRILLGLTRNSVQFSFFNMPIEVPDLRAQLRALLGIPLWPQLLLRVGYCLTEPAQSPRRPVEEVIMNMEKGIT